MLLLLRKEERHSDFELERWIKESLLDQKGFAGK